jgi:O-antigen/teichoic acid export membrane protein
MRSDPAANWARLTIRSDFVRHGSLVFAASIIVNGFNYLFHILISRKLGVDAYGAMSSMIAFLTIVSIPAAIAQTIVAKYSAEFWAAREIGRLRALVFRALRTFSAAGIAAAAICAVCAPAIGHYLQITDVRSLVLFSVVVGTTALLAVLRGTLQGVQDFRAFAISTACDACAKAALGIAFVYLGFGLLGAVGGFTAGSIAALTYTIFAVKKCVGAGTRPRLRLDPRRLLQTAGGVTVSTGVLTFMGFADILLVKHFFPPNVAGIYGVVSLIGKMLLFVVAFVPTIILPKATHLAATGRSPKMLLLEAGVVMAAISGAGLAIIYAFPRQIVVIVAGPSFISAAGSLFPYGAAMTLLAATTVAVTYKIGVHRFDFVLPLLIIASAEILIIVFRHAMIAQVIEVLLIGHCAAFIASLYRITAPVGLAQPISLSREIA